VVFDEESRKLSGVSPGVVARFMGGQRGLTLDTVDRLARGLGLRLVEVATRRRPVRPTSPPGPGEQDGPVAIPDPGSEGAEHG
jgi:hypothetical protein